MQSDDYCAPKKLATHHESLFIAYKGACAMQTLGPFPRCYYSACNEIPSRWYLPQNQDKSAKFLPLRMRSICCVIHRLAQRKKPAFSQPLRKSISASGQGIQSLTLHLGRARSAVELPSLTRLLSMLSEAVTSSRDARLWDL